MKELAAPVHMAIYRLSAVAFQYSRGAFVYLIIFACAMEALVAHVYLSGRSGPISIPVVGAIVVALALTGFAFVVSRIPF